MANSIILFGTFFAQSEEEYTAEKLRAMRLVEKIGSELAVRYSEIADLYRNGVLDGEERIRYIDIAEALIPHKSHYFPKVAESAVGYAIRQLIPEGERKELTRLRRARQLEDIFGGFESEAFREHCKRASVIRHQLHGVDAEAMTRGRGFVPWSKEERVYVYRRMQEGVTDYEDLSIEVNDLFHEGNPIRHKKSVYDVVRYESRRKNK